MKDSKSKFQLRRLRQLSNVALVLMLTALCAVTMGGGAMYSVFTSAGNGVHYSGRGDNNEVALMVNVYGGGEYVEGMLSLLEERGATATFFLGGCWADDNNDTVKKIAAAGHEIGNHGYFHKDHSKLSYADNKTEIIALNNLVKTICGREIKLFAPPSGAYSKTTTQVCKDINMQVIMWSKDTIDWRDKDESLVISRATKDIKAGDMVLMHPTAHTLKALPQILDAYESAGLKTVSVSTIIGLTII